LRFEYPVEFSTDALGDPICPPSGLEFPAPAKSAVDEVSLGLVAETDRQDRALAE
jgi:hypothetical protein